MSKFLLVVLVITAALHQVNAQKKEKPYTEWNRGYAERMIKESAWAKSYQSAQGTAAIEQMQSSREQSSQVIIGRSAQASAQRQQTPTPVQIRLNSALPIRQAIVRLQQIGVNYDKMSGEDKAKFDNSVKDFLNCAVCEKFYVITLTKFKNSGQTVEEGIFQSFKLKDLKDKVFLANDKGDRRALVQFIPPQKDGESAVLFFQRNDNDGKPLITTENKEVDLVFAADFLDNSSNPYGWLLPRKFDFNVSKMVVDGKVQF